MISVKQLSIMLDIVNRRGTFWKHVKLDSTSGCWLWIGVRDRDGYGVVAWQWPPGRVHHVAAHRVAYLLLGGSLRETDVLDHRCGNRACVNWRHCEPVSRGENTRRGNFERAWAPNRTEAPPDPATGRRSALLERLWGFIEPEPTSGCWIWLGARDKRGYGRLSFGGKSGFAHRVLYETYKSAVPSGHELDHRCRLTSCVNPDHLEPVTHRVNVLRGNGLTARYARRTNCIHGHSLADAHMWKNGRQRICRICRTCGKCRFATRSLQRRIG